MKIVTGMVQVSIMLHTAKELLIMLKFTVGSALTKVASERVSNEDSFLQLSQVTKAGAVFTATINENNYHTIVLGTTMG